MPKVLQIALVTKYGQMWKIREIEMRTLMLKTPHLFNNKQNIFKKNFQSRKSIYFYSMYLQPQWQLAKVIISLMVEYEK